MLSETVTTSPRITRRSVAKKTAPQLLVLKRNVPRLDAADKSVFEAIASSSQFTLAGLKKLVAH